MIMHAKDTLKMLGHINPYIHVQQHIVYSFKTYILGLESPVSLSKLVPSYWNRSLFQVAMGDIWC